MDSLISKKTKSPLLKFYKSKLLKKDLINKSNNMIFNKDDLNRQNLKTFRKEISKNKNKTNSLNFKTSKNSPNSSIIRYSNKEGQIESKDFSNENKNIIKKDIIINKMNNRKISETKNKIRNDLFEEFFIRKIKKIYKKNSNGQISQRQNSTKNIFNNIKNNVSINTSRLTKNKIPLYGNPHFYYYNNSKILNQANNNMNDDFKSKKENSSISKSGLNSINNSSLVPSSSTSFRKTIKDNNRLNNKAYYNNFLNRQKENNANKEKGYIGNYNLMKHIENKYDNRNNNLYNNKYIFNHKNIEDPVTKKYIHKNNSMKNKIIDNSSNSRIKKISAVDYLYNNKHKKHNSKYDVKCLEENSNGLTNKIKNKDISTYEINGSYVEVNKLNKSSNLSKKNTNNKSSINKKRIKNNAYQNKSNNEQDNNFINPIDSKNEDIFKISANSSCNNIYSLLNNIKYMGNYQNNEKSNISSININKFFNKKKINKDNLDNYLNQGHKSNILNIKGISEINNKALFSGNYFIKNNNLPSNNMNNDKNKDKNHEINIFNNNDINNNPILNISNNNNCSNINNQNININININNTSENKNSNNFLNNNFIDAIKNYNKNKSDIINNISSKINHINYIKNNNEYENKQINDKNNELIYQENIQNNNTSNKNKEKIFDENQNKKINDKINYNNYNNNSNNQENLLNNKLVTNVFKKNNLINLDKIDENKNINKDDNINNLISDNTQKLNDIRGRENFKLNDNNIIYNDKIDKKENNKNIILKNEFYDVNLNDINDFSPISDEKNINDNIQEKINKQNQLHINKNNISLIGNNINNIFFDKINKKNKEDENKKYHKYSQSQSMGKKLKELNKKIIEDISNLSNIKIKNNFNIENQQLFGNNNNNKSKFETNSEKEDTSKNNILNINNHLDKINKSKEKKIINLNDLIDSKENLKENNENEIQKDQEKDRKKKIFSKKIDIFSLNINNIIDNSINNKNKGKIKEIKQVNSNNKNNKSNDMLCVPEFPEIRKKDDNIMFTTMSKDCEYYKEEMEKLSNYIKNYYDENGKYPESRIEFYLYGRQIGHGAFGKVNLALHVASGRLVAIKTFSKKNLKNKNAKQKIKHEIDILSKLRHPFINQILDSFETEKHIFIVMEYVCGDLLGFIRKRGKLSESISKLIFKQIIEGLKYIHKKKIVHRDIKLDNILIDLSNTVKICDFGVSRKLSNGDIMYEHCGTPAYIAPEIFENKGYEGYLCDIWSAGVTLYYMLSGSQPFRANSMKELEKKVMKGKFDEIEEVSKEANDLIREMLKIDPKERIDIDRILKHPWLKNVDIENRKNLNLFTESEKILLSKFDVDYLTANKEELIENFSLKNLETNNNETNIKNIGNTKSVIFAPYNSYIEESKKDPHTIFEEEKIYKELKILNDICKFGWKVQQANINYELSNNNDFDNGIIKTQKEEDIKIENEKIEKKFEEKMLNDKLSGLNTPRVQSANDSFEESEKIIVKREIIKQIEKDIGYDKKYIINCIRKNKINYATATYYLLAKDN